MANDAESYRYKQSATYRLFCVLYDLRALRDWSVNEKALHIIERSISELNKLQSVDFAETEDGYIIRELLK